MNRKLDRLVDECFTKMQTEGWSVEQCLDASSEYREVLEPLLSLGVEMHTCLAPESARAEFRQNARKRIMNQMRARVIARRDRRQEYTRRRSRWYLRPAYILTSLALVLALLISGFGVVQASASSLPGDALYEVKLAGEWLALTLSLSAAGDQELLAEFAEERLEEAEALIAQNRLEDVPEALEGFESRWSELEVLAEEIDELQPGSLEHLQARLDRHIQILQGVMENAPEPAREALQNALEKSSHSQDVLESVHGEGHPGENAPGQNKPETGQDHEEDQPGNSNQRGRPDQGGSGPPEKPGRGGKGPPPWADKD